MSSNFKVDFIVTSAKELKDEKSCLEQKLNEMRRSRVEVEKKLSSSKAKLHQTREMNLKMRETLKIAEYKVSETQSQLDILQNAVAEKRKAVDSLNEALDKQKQAQMDETIKFESRLSDLSIKLHDARHFHQDENLKDEISNTKEKCRETGKMAVDMESHIDGLNKILSELQLEKEQTRSQAEMDCFPALLQKQILSATLADLKDAEEQKYKLEQRKATLENELANQIS